MASLLHEHKDHYKGVPDALTAGQEVFATKGTIDGLGIKAMKLNVITINVPFFMSVILKFFLLRSCTMQKSHADFL